jgi:hypothetical protein
MTYKRDTDRVLLYLYLYSFLPLYYKYSREVVTSYMVIVKVFVKISKKGEEDGFMFSILKCFNAYGLFWSV